MSEADNPRLQCERCGKWRRLITRGEQIMFPYSQDMPGFKGERDYDCLCEPCREEIEAKETLPNGNGSASQTPTMSSESNPGEN